MPYGNKSHYPKMPEEGEKIYVYIHKPQLVPAELSNNTILPLSRISQDTRRTLES